MNRRNNLEATFPSCGGRWPWPARWITTCPCCGFAGSDGKARAIVFGYACHCTVLDFYKFCGDYAGFAQIELEQRYPGSQAMFWQDAAATRTRFPAGAVELAQSYGRQLADSVAHVLEGADATDRGAARTGYQEIDLAFGPLPSRGADRAGLPVERLLHRQPRQALARRPSRTRGRLPRPIPTRSRPGGWTT